MKSKTIQARYGLKRSITFIENNIYRVSGLTSYCRCSEVSFDFEGGPMLVINDNFYDLGTIIELMYTYPADKDPLLGGWSRVYVKIKPRNKKA